MVATFIQGLLHCVTNAHILHLQSTSYSEHMALGAFYEGLQDLVDGLAESIQGKYGLIQGYSDDYIAPNPNENALAFVEAVSEFVTNGRVSEGFPQDSEIQNEIDSIQTLINTTIYKLRYLK